MFLSRQMWSRIFSKTTIFSTIFHLLPNLELSKYSPSQTYPSYGLISRTLKTAQIQEVLSTDALMSVVLSQLFEIRTWT